jgi:tetratricopeptide (TPR) repeat protein
MPSWEELMAPLGEELGLDIPTTDPTEIAQRYEEEYGRVELVEELRKRIRPHEATPAECHRRLLALPFETIYTTNFDFLLEHCARSMRKACRVLVGEEQLAYHAGYAETNIIKMHGDFQHENALVITKSDYDNFLSDYRAVATHLGAMLLTRTPLFIGYSLRDPDFRAILRIIDERVGKHRRMGYVISLGAEAKGEEAQPVRNIRVIRPDESHQASPGHALAAFFDALAECARQARARRGAGFVYEAVQFAHAERPAEMAAEPAPDLAGEPEAGPPEAPAMLRTGAALSEAARFASEAFKYEDARRLHRESLAIAEDLGDRRSIAATKQALGTLAYLQGDYEEARRLWQENLAIKQELGDRPGIASTKHQLGMLAHEQHDYDEARRLYGESLAIRQELGDRAGIALSKHELGRLASHERDYEEAGRLYNQSLAINDELGDRRGMAKTKHQLGMLAYDQGDYEEARRLYTESLATEEELGDRRGIAISKHELGMLAEIAGDYEEARRLYQQSLAMLEGIGIRPAVAKIKHNLGNVAQQEGDYGEARRLYEESLAIKEELGDRPGIARTKHQLGTLAEEEGDRAGARELYREALAIFEALGSPEVEKARRLLERVSSAEPKKKQ